MNNVTVSRRRLRRLALTVVPSSQLLRLRSWYEAISTRGRRAKGTVMTGADAALTVSIAQPPLDFRMALESRWALEGHLHHPRQSVELAAFIEESRRGGTLFDVGANDGLFSVVFCRANASSRAIAFEPSWVLCDRLTLNAELNGARDRIDVRCVAVGDRVGRQAMLTNVMDGYVQVAEFHGNEGSQWAESVVEVTTLDREAAAGPPTVVKIDVEGFELEVLQGAKQLLQKFRPVVFLELHLTFLEQRGIDPLAVTRLLCECGYTLFNCAGQRVPDQKATRSWAPAVHVIGRPK